MSQPSPWAPLTVVAAAIRRPSRTVRTWAHRLQVRSCCDLASRQVLVWVNDVFRQDEAARRRRSP